MTAADLLRYRWQHRQQTLNNRRYKFYVPGAEEVMLECYKGVVGDRIRTYEENKEVEDCIRRVGKWLSDPYAPEGLLLAGTPGNGKTTVVSTIKELIAASQRPDPVRLDYHGNPDTAFLKVVSATDLPQLYSSNENSYHYLKEVGLLAIDDVGVEPLDYTKFGNIINPFLDIFYARYEKKLMTIITTNLSKNEIADRYGERFADRANEMMFRVAFPYGVTFRHNSYQPK